MSPDHDDGGGGRSAGQRLEWALGAAGAALVLTLLGFLGYQGTARDHGPRLQVRVVDVQRTPAGFATTVDVLNEGGGTARSVQLSGEVTSGGTTLSQANATVPYVPPQSHRRAVLVFGTDPSRGEVRVRAVGYTVP
ncbi:hypothetical protein MO973_36385 [Paenibacillus sp. TRM 82003]|uniref:hypothetical protein n=1 Tax=Kineococcus sp. TRM81007 TaxID=2925831 RepID=UPI001F57F2B1|nr:hypothetical protein [Kineococcus sp. TRM81007]MCI2240003.1 hypothetical protein [Kineococcus sp. TRM81007]MCI3925692.1 hypothetical protein [Paenibacillus sp. TRM 82003]